MNYVKRGFTDDASSADMNGTNMAYMDQGIYDANTLVKTAAQWISDNTILANGQFGKESDTGKIKSGDGSTSWNSIADYTNTNTICGANRIYPLFLFGTVSSSDGVDTYVDHGIDSSKIIGITSFVKPSSSTGFAESYTKYSGYQYNIDFDSTSVRIRPITGNCYNILGKSVVIYILYTN